MTASRGTVTTALRLARRDLHAHRRAHAPGAIGERDAQLDHAGTFVADGNHRAHFAGRLVLAVDELRHGAGGDAVGGGQRRPRHHFQILVVHQAQQRRAAGHVFAGLLQALGDDAVERRAHRGAIHIEARAIARDARLLHVLLGHALARQRFVQLALRHHVAQRLQPLALRG